MIEVPLQVLRRHSLGGGDNMAAVLVQGYLAHKKPRPPRTLQREHAKGPMMVLGGGGHF